MNTNKQQMVLAVLAMMSAWTASASELTIPNSFSSGSRAVAAEVNGNFTAVQDAVNDNNTRIGANETAIADADARITDNEARITTNEAVITDNSNAITQASMADAVAYAASTNSSASLGAADTVVRTLTLQTPVDGHALISFTSWFTCASAAACVVRCTLSPNGGTSLNTQFFTLESVPNGEYSSLSVNAAVPIVAGDTVINAVCDTFSGNGTLGDPAIMVAFSSKLYQP